MDFFHRMKADPTTFMSIPIRPSSCEHSHQTSHEETQEENSKDLVSSRVIFLEKLPPIRITWINTYEMRFSNGFQLPNGSHGLQGKVFNVLAATILHRDINNLLLETSEGPNYEVTKIFQIIWKHEKNWLLWLFRVYSPVVWGLW